MSFLLILLMVLAAGFESILYRFFAKGEKQELTSFLNQFIGTLIFLPFFILSFFGVFKIPQLSWAWLVPFASSLIYVPGIILVFWVYKKGEVSLFKPLDNLSPLIVLLFSIIFLKESINAVKLIGILSIFLGLGFLKKKENLLKSFISLAKDPVCQAYFLFLIIFSLAQIIDKIGVSYFSPFPYAFLTFFIPMILLFVSQKIYLKKNELKQLIQKKLLFALLATFTTAARYLLFLFLVTFVSVSSISAISKLNILISLGLAQILLKEKIESRWLGAVFIIMGGILLTLKGI